MIRVLIADDEPIIRRGIRNLLSKRDDFVVVGESANGESTVENIRTLAPDLVFLDVQMPQMDGFGVIREVGPESMPAVVFITAFDEYAVRAFDANAVDYLLKPFDEERFTRCIEKVKEHISSRRNAEAMFEKLSALVSSQAKPKGPSDRIAIKNSDRITLLQVEEIDWIEAADNYVEIHAGKQVHLMRETLSNLEQRLQPFHFLRVHRSRLVNAERIKQLHPLFHGEYELVLSDGTRITSSRHYRETLQQLIN